MHTPPFSRLKDLLQSIMGATEKRWSNIVDVISIFRISRNKLIFGPTEVQSGQLKHFLFVSSACRKSMFGPIKLTPCAVQRRSTNELVQYRDATASSYPPQSQIPIDPSPLSSDTSNALRSPLLNQAGICSAGIGQQMISAAVTSRRFRIPAFFLSKIWEHLFRTGLNLAILQADGRQALIKY